MRILGIDPGYATVGFGILDYQGMHFHTVEYGAILTEAHADFAQRLTVIYEDMLYLLDRFSVFQGDECMVSCRRGESDPNGFSGSVLFFVCGELQHGGCFLGTDFCPTTKIGDDSC